MAFTEFYCNASTGNNMNGGSDENTSPSYSATNGGWDSGTGVFTPISGDPSASVTIGQYAHVFTDGSTTPTFIGRVTAVNSTTVTVSTTLKSGTAPTTAGTGISINVGGVWKGPNGTDVFPVNFVTGALKGTTSTAPRINFKNNADYTPTATMTIPATSSPVIYEGYATTVGDEGQAKFDGGTGTKFLVLNANSLNTGSIKYIWFYRNGSSGSNISGITCNNTTVEFYRCVFSNMSSSGVTSSTFAGATYVECESYSNNAVGFGLGCCIRCIAHSNGTYGFDYTNWQQSLAAENCVAHNNGSNGFHIRATAARNFIFRNCDAYENTGAGFNIQRDAGSGNFYILLENCNSIKNSNYGVAISGSGTAHILLFRKIGLGAGTQANTSGGIQSVSGHIIENTSFSYPNDVTPWVDPENGDFRISLTEAKGAGQGTFLQTSSLYSGGTIGYPDIGAAQHLDSGGSTVKGMRILGG
jgi:hypothetical protein